MFINAVVRVGYEKTAYTISNEKGYVQVCVSSTLVGIEETFSIKVASDDSSLGEYSIMCFSIACFHFIFNFTVNSGILINVNRMFNIFVNNSIHNDRKCFNISADYNVRHLCSFFADCINRHLMLELTITNGSHVTFEEGKNVTEIVVEIPDTCLCKEEEAPVIIIAAVVAPSLLVIFAVASIVVVVFLMRKCRKNKKEG